METDHINDANLEIASSATYIENKGLVVSITNYSNTTILVGDYIYDTAYQEFKVIGFSRIDRPTDRSEYPKMLLLLSCNKEKHISGDRFIYHSPHRPIVL